MKKVKKQMIATAVLKGLLLALIAVSGRPSVEESHAMHLHVCLPGNTLESLRSSGSECFWMDFFADIFPYIYNNSDIALSSYGLLTSMELIQAMCTNNYYETHTSRVSSQSSAKGLHITQGLVYYRKCCNEIKKAISDA